MIWAFGVSLPVIFINGSPAASSPAFGAAGDIVGVILFVIGLVTQTVADLQKDAFRSSPDSRGRACTVGLWGWSRHPNFFGEMRMWWGAFVLASPSFGPSAALNSTFGWGAATVISPLLTFAILMFLSGMPTAEGDNQKRYMRTRRARDEFVAYRERTSPVVPLPPPLYKALPGWAKAVFLFEWPIYATSWDVVEEAPAAPRASASGKDASGADGFQARAAVPQAEQPPPPPPPAE